MTTFCRCFYEHSLSIFLTALFASFSFWSFLLEEGGAEQSYVQNLAGDTFGALLVVVATKYFMEKGSPQSK